MNITKDKWINNINSEYKVPIENQIKLMNANSQFIIEMANILKMQSYSITALAIQLCNYFFVKHSYFNYDRFIIGSSSILLASKMRDRKPQLKQIGLAYFNFLKHKLYKYKQHSIVLNDRILETIIEKIAINENTLLKTIQFNFDVQLAFDYLEPIIRMYFVKESYYSLTKMILFDIYRTHIILLYDPISILMAALFLCSQIMNQMPVPEKFILQYNRTDKLKLEDEQLAFQAWIEDVNKNQQNIIDNSNQYGINLSRKDIDLDSVLEILRTFNQFVQLYSYVEENLSEFEHSDLNTNQDIIIKPLEEAQFDYQQPQEQTKQQVSSQNQQQQFEPTDIQERVYDPSYIQ